MASNEDIIREADYFLENEVTVEQASSDLGISKRTLQLHMKKLESIAPDKFKLVEDKKKSNEKQGRIVGGTVGKRKPNWSSDDAMEVASQMLNKEMTYRGAEEVLGIPKSTLHEMVHSAGIDIDTSSMLYALSEANKRGMTVEQYLEEHNRTHVTSDMITKETQEETLNSRRSK